ncbi:HNH endonuclease [Gordoniibacillus kamchatkensis]|uniref:HNH endonuclease n=1 Tax=Gordoniibacillus kamchatkensis TaxID=1590651 RepID=UPI0009E1CC15|nr:HNH endonuclease [Paenibacillus sp. VKM B-2647]
MPQVFIDRFYNLPAGPCINCEHVIESQIYYYWQERNVYLCSDCLLALYERCFTIPRFSENSAEKYRKAKIPESLRWKIWERDDFTCQYCGTRTNLTIDHVIPEVQGGSMVEENLATACITCNTRKGGRTPDQAGMKLLKDQK